MSEKLTYIHIPERLFAHGPCLAAGPMVGDTDVEHIANLIRSYVDATHDNPAA